MDNFGFIRGLLKFGRISLEGREKNEKILGFMTLFKWLKIKIRRIKRNEYSLFDQG